MIEKHTSYNISIKLSFGKEFLINPFLWHKSSVQFVLQLWNWRYYQTITWIIDFAIFKILSIKSQLFKRPQNLVDTSYSKWEEENQNDKLHQKRKNIWTLSLIVHFAITKNHAKSTWIKNEIQAEFHVVSNNFFG